MSSYEDIRARIDADKAKDLEFIDQDTLEGARADVVSDILKITANWLFKAEEYPPEETYVAQRAIVSDEILDILNKHLWDEGE
mgnify:CR=1 FL=1